MFQSAKEKAKALSVKYVAPAVGLTVAGVTAAHADTAAAITSAYTTAGTNLGAAVTGIIGLVAIVTGVGFIISMLRK